MHHVMIESDTPATAQEVRAVLALQTAVTEEPLESTICSVISSGACGNSHGGVA